MTALEYMRSAFPEYRKRCPEERWEDYERAIMSGAAVAVVLPDARGPAGFAVGRKVNRELYLAAVYLERPMPFDKLVSYAERTALSWGCDRIRIRSHRRGWIRKLEPFGFVRDPVYEMCKEVSNGV